MCLLVLIGKNIPSKPINMYLNNVLGVNAKPKTNKR